MCIVRADWWGRTLALALGAWVFCKPWAHGRESSGICCENDSVGVVWRCSDGELPVTARYWQKGCVVWTVGLW